VFDFSFLIHSQVFCLDCVDVEDETDNPETSVNNYPYTLYNNT